MIAECVYTFTCLLPKVRYNLNHELPEMFVIFYSNLYTSKDSDGGFLVIRGDWSIIYKALGGMSIFHSLSLFGAVFNFSINVKGL